MRILRAALWIGLLLSPLAWSKPSLLASIKPLALIAQEVVGEDMQVEVLLPVSASPHDYPLNVSDHKRLRSAALVLWVGPALESFLARPLRNLPAERQLSAYTLAALIWPALEDDHGHSEAQDHSHEHDADPHLWLNPRNAAAIATALAEQLARQQPALAQVYRTRAAAFAEAMTALDAELAAAMAPLKNVGFAVYHEGYSHFVQHYGLRQLAYVTYVPELRPGARHMAQLRKVLAAGGECIFSEPYQKTDQVDALAQQLGLRQGQLDAIGELSTSYAQLLRQMAQVFTECLGQGRVKAGG